MLNNTNQLIVEPQTFTKATTSSGDPDDETRRPSSRNHPSRPFAVIMAEAEEKVRHQDSEHHTKKKTELER